MRPTRLLPPLALMALIFVLSAQSDLDSGLGIWDLVARKIGHMVTFGALCWLWLRGLRGAVARPLLWAAAISFLYAVSDEYHQSRVEGRHGTPVDVAIDAVGIAIASIWAIQSGPFPAAADAKRSSRR